MSKLERFTINARYALKAAQTEAQQANHNYIGTEHLLLGLLSVKASTAKMLILLCCWMRYGARPAVRPCLIPRWLDRFWRSWSRAVRSSMN